VTGRIILIGMALGLTAAVVGAAPAKKAAPPAADDAPEASQLMQSCDAHKFETVVHGMVDGKPEQSKVKLCGKEGQTETEWIDTLKDAVAKLDSNTEMAAEMRNQITAALKSEIARLELKSAKAFGSTPPAEKSTALDGIAALPPLPQGKPPQAVALPPPRAPAQAAPKRDYAALPPLPTAPPAPTRVLARDAGGSVVILPKPKMTLSCYTPGEMPEGPCTGFTRFTLLTVRAGEDLPAGTSIRFVRDGNARADVELAQLKKGKSMRVAMPVDVCRHAVGGRLELKIVRSGQEVGSDGPYNLNC
jgi:hypothetical protein